MKPQKYGKIINIASVAARIGGIASSVSYATSKGGLLTATKCYAKVLGQDNINVNVNAVCPGVIAFLANEDSKYITGSGIDVNGGFFML